VQWLLSNDKIKNGQKVHCEAQMFFNDDNSVPLNQSTLHLLQGAFKVRKDNGRGFKTIGVMDGAI
jgi:hypothetical protein